MKIENFIWWCGGSFLSCLPTNYKVLVMWIEVGRRQGLLTLPHKFFKSALKKWLFIFSSIKKWIFFFRCMGCLDMRGNSLCRALRFGFVWVLLSWGAMNAMVIFSPGKLLWPSDPSSLQGKQHSALSLKITPLVPVECIWGWFLTVLDRSDATAYQCSSPQSSR